MQKNDTYIYIYVGTKVASCVYRVAEGQTRLRRLSIHAQSIPMYGILHFIVLCVSVLHRYCVFLFLTD